MVPSRSDLSFLSVERETSRICQRDYVDNSFECFVDHTYCSDDSVGNFVSDLGSVEIELRFASQEQKKVDGKTTILSRS